MRHHHDSRMSSRFIALMLMLVFGRPLIGQVRLDYVSPGVQIGRTLGVGNFVSAQITVGAFGDDNRGYPGATIGMRWQEKGTTVYMDVQLSAIAVGAGIGIALIFPQPGRGRDKLIESGLRFKGYAGMLAYATYDVLKLKGKPYEKNIGLIVVKPSGPIFEFGFF